MVKFAFLDYFWLVLYLILMTGAGGLFYNLGKRSEADFFLAGRSLPWWLPAMSVPYANGAPNLSVDIPALIQFAKEM